MAYEGMAPEVYADQLLTRLNDNLVLGSVVNRDYEGEIQAYGDSVVISEVGPVTISTYTPSSTSALTLQTIGDAQQILRIDQAKSYSWWIDDVSGAQMKPKAMDDMIDQSAWGIANNIDEYIAAFYSKAALAMGGTSSAGVDTTSTNVLRIFESAAAELSKANAPMGSWWIVLPPKIYQKAVLAGITKATDNMSILANGGLAGVFYGFRVYVSNNIAALSGTDRYPILAGYRGSITLAVQVLKSETARPAQYFKTIVKGLVVYGAKVTRPNQLGVYYADYTAEAT